MKKNITINMCGRLYAIDEDAYELLSRYIQTLRTYFMKQEGGEEIANDIESRCAELLYEVKLSGQEAITIEHVQQIIHRVGELEDIASEIIDENTDSDDEKARNGYTTTESGSAAGKQNGAADKQNAEGGKSSSAFSRWSENLKKKRFYLEPKGKLVAGVFTGCSNYFGGNVLIWRLVFVLLVLCGPLVFSLRFLHAAPFFGPIFAPFAFFALIPRFAFNLLPIILYTLVAFLAPSAKTPEHRLRMKGKEVNPQNLTDEVEESVKEDVGSEKQPGDQTTTKKAKTGCLGCLGCLGTFIMLIICLFALGFIIPFLACLFIIVAVTSAPAPSAENILENIFGHSGETLIYACQPELWIMAICVLIASFIPIYCAIHSICKMLKKCQPMGFGQRIAWISGWVVAILGIVICGIHIAAVADQCSLKDREELEERKRIYRETHMHDGVFFNDEDWEYFTSEGWTLLKHANCSNDRYTYSGQYYTGEKDVRYLDAYSGAHELVYQAERVDTLTPGIYRLTALGRCNTDGRGAFIYAETENAGVLNKWLCEIPPYGSEHYDADEYDDEEEDTTDEDDDDFDYEAGDDFDESSTYFEQEISLGIVHLKISKSSSATAGKSKRPAYPSHTRLDRGWSILTLDSICVEGTQPVRYGVSTDQAYTGRRFNASWFSATDFKLDRIGNLKGKR